MEKKIGTEIRKVVCSGKKTECQGVLRNLKSHKNVLHVIQMWFM